MENKQKAISLEIFKNPLYRGCSNNGISEKFNEVLVLCDRGHIDVDLENPPENLCVIKKRDLFGKTYYHCEPYASVKPGSVGWMAGGSIVATCDSRFYDMADGHPLQLHDRQETREENDLYSR